MPVGEDDALWKHLREEFGAAGCRAVEFLETAAGFLCAGAALPRRAETVCYCVREALKEIPKAAGVEARPLWQKVSREVVDAARRHAIAAEGPDAGAAALAELMQAIKDLECAHSQEPVHQRRLVAMLSRRAGAAPQADPVEAYQALVERADKMAHASATDDQAQALYDEARGVLRQLFLPPELRLPELAALAAKRAPTNEDVARLTSLIASPRHLDYFFARAATAEWLFLLDSSPFVVPPEGSGAWPVARMIGRLAPPFDGRLAEWLRAAQARWGASEGRSHVIARTALALGPAGRDVVMAALRAHHGTQLDYLALQVVEQVDAADPVVVEIADTVLGPSAGIDSYARDVVGKALVEGVTAANWRSRAEIVVYKVRAVIRDDPGMVPSTFERSGSVAAPDELHGEYLLPQLVALLVATLVAGQRAGAGLTDLLASVDSVADSVRSRLRVWLLGQFDDAPMELLVDELASAVCSRDPTRDDVPLVDRVVSASPDYYVERFRDALGPAPDVQEVGRRLAMHDLDEGWFRCRWWSALFPVSVTSAWAKVNAVLAAAYGPADRWALGEPRHVEAGWGRSPRDEAQLAGMPVLEAARWVADWRPDPEDWLVGSRELARVLEAVARKAPAAWAVEPLAVIAALREPMYVAHYFQGLAAADRLPDTAAADLVEAVEFIGTHPWTARVLGKDQYDYDPTWEHAEAEGLAVLQRLAALNVGFGDRHAAAWRFVLDSAVRPDEPSSFDDPMTAALKRARTRALTAVFGLLAWEHRASGRVSTEALDVLDGALHLAGVDGVQHRAVIVPRLPHLVAVAPAWVAARRDLIFGDGAPDGLGRRSVDLFLQWAPPHRWFLDTERDALREAVRRDTPRATWFWLIAMLSGVNGYGVRETVDFAIALGDARLSDAVETVGRLLRAEDSSPERVALAVSFAREVLDRRRPPAVARFGWLAEVSALDDQTWLDVTAAAVRLTHGQLDRGRRVAERAAGTRSIRGLQILRELVQGLPDDYDRATVTRSALTGLREAGALRDTNEYRQLRSTLLEQGAFEAEDL